MNKILLLTDWFYPGFKAGGPIRSCLNLVELIGSDYAVHILCGDRDLGDDKPYPGIETEMWNHQIIPGVSVFYTQKLSFENLRIRIREVDPDVIYLNHLYSPDFVVKPLLLLLAGKLKARVVLSPRGALHGGALHIKPYKKYPYLLFLRLLGIHRKISFHATNAYEASAIHRFFPNASITVLENPPASSQQPFSGISKVPGVLNMLFVARIHPIKGLHVLIRSLREIHDKQIRLVIIGPVEDEDYWHSCQQELRVLGANISIEYAGARSNQEVAHFLSETHLFVLPTAGENFGHAIFESFLAGRPVLISDKTPWLNLQALQLGWSLPLNNQKLWVEAIQNCADWDQPIFDLYARTSWEMARNFREQPGLTEKYIALFA